MDGFDLSMDTSEWEKLLDELPVKVQHAALQGAMQAGGDVFKEAMIAHAPERTDEQTPESNSLPPGILKQDIKVQVINRSDHIPEVRIGPGEISGRVGLWVNKGWDLVKGGRKGKKGRFVRHIDGTHFMERAFDEAVNKAAEAVIESLGEALDENK
jgi:hypothetical protein